MINKFNLITKYLADGFEKFFTLCSYIFAPLMMALYKEEKKIVLDGNITTKDIQRMWNFLFVFNVIFSVASIFLMFVFDSIWFLFLWLLMIEIIKVSFLFEELDI